MERLRGSSHQRKDDHHELQIGRLKQDRVRLPRGEDVSGNVKGRKVGQKKEEKEEKIPLSDLLSC